MRQEGKGHGLREQLSSHRKQDRADHDGSQVLLGMLARTVKRVEASSGAGFRIFNASSVVVMIGEWEAAKAVD